MQLGGQISLNYEQYAGNPVYLRSSLQQISKMYLFKCYFEF